MTESFEPARRIHPEPPSESPADAEQLDVWGFADSGFALNEQGQLCFRGDRYPISGQVLPDFLPWARETIDAELEPADVHPSGYPTAVPEPRQHAGFEADARALLGEEGLCRDPEQRLRRAHGHTQEEMWAVKYGRLERVPDLVVRPADAEQVRALVELAARHDVCLIPYGGGTNVSLALAPPPEEQRPVVSVDMRRMRRVLWIDPDDRTACIEAGANGREIAEVLARHGFTPGPRARQLRVLDAGGLDRHRGQRHEEEPLREHRGPGVVGGCGDPRRRAAAPGGAGAGVGGRRSLALAAGLRGAPGHRHQRPGQALPPARGAALRLGALPRLRVRRGVPARRPGLRRPAGQRAPDGQPAVPVRPGAAPAPGRVGRLWKHRLQKLWLLRVLGFETDRMVACTLLYEGSAAEVAEQRQRIRSLAKRHRGLDGGSENGERGYALTFAIAYIRDFMMRHWVLGESFETTVPWSRCLQLVSAVRQRLWQEHAKRGLPGRPFVSARVTQLYETGVCVYFYFAIYHRGVEDASHVYAEMERAAREEILRAGGSLSHHHGVGKLRRSFLPEVFSETALEWRAALERAVDPKNLFGSANGWRGRRD